VLLKRVVTDHVRGALPDNPTLADRGLRLVGRAGAPTLEDPERVAALDPQLRKVIGVE